MPYVPKHPLYWVDRPDATYLLVEGATFGRDSRGCTLVMKGLPRDGASPRDEWRLTSDADGYAGTDLPTELRRGLPDARCTLATLGAGDFHPLIWRVGSPPLAVARHEEMFLNRVAAAHGLRQKLDEVFRFVEPVPENASTFSHEVRELLILAATEVETGFRAVLEQNGYVRPGKQPHDPDRWNTTDFVMLRDPLRLVEYEVKLPLHPRWPAIRPFAGWDTSKSTQTLTWFDAYNATKHDRDKSFARGSLDHAVAAVAAVHVLVIAQFGLPQFGAPRSFVPSSGFTVTKAPAFEAREHVYFPGDPPRGIAWTPVPFFTL